MTKLLPLFYLPPVSWFAEFLAADYEIVVEKWEHFQKQTYRNRAHIYGANGKLSLIIPINHNGNRAVQDIKISDRENWQQQHWKSIKYAYQSSPYFEYYEDQLSKIYDFNGDSLFQFNIHALEVMLKILKSEKSFNFTSEYLKNPEMQDFREQFSAKTETERNFKPYYQVFSDKYGFLADLSVIDVLCNIGPETTTYIQNINK